MVSVQYLFLSHTAMNKTETFSETALSLPLQNALVSIKKKVGQSSHRSNNILKMHHSEGICTMFL